MRKQGHRRPCFFAVTQALFPLSPPTPDPYIRAGAGFP